MLTNIDEFATYICEMGRMLFGEDFVYEKCNYSMRDAYFVKQLFQRDEDPSFYKFYVHNVQGEEMGMDKVAFELMEGVEGVEFVCQDGSFLQKSDIDKLKESKKCSFGQRSNCKGVRWIGGEGELSWYQIHFFRTRDKTCVDIFLDSLSRFKKCGEVSFEVAEIQRFEARMEEKIRSLFEHDGYGRKYYPCFDEKDSFYYTCRAFCFYNINLVLQLRLYPHKQELVCENPLGFWKKWLHIFFDGKIAMEYQEDMEQLERRFIKELVEKDCTCILLAGNEEPDRGISIGEFKTENVATAEYFLEQLKIYLDKAENDRAVFRERDLNRDENAQQKWYV